MEKRNTEIIKSLLLNTTLNPNIIFAEEDNEFNEGDFEGKRRI